MATPNIYGNPGPDGSSRRLIDQKGQGKMAVPKKSVNANGTANKRGSVPNGPINPGMDNITGHGRGNAGFASGTPKSLGF